jgi:phage protein U
MIDDVELSAVQWLRQETRQGFAEQRVAGLDGAVHQKVGRRSHRVVASGVLLPDGAADTLAALQGKASAGATVTFTADIVTALAVEQMVVESFAAEQVPGSPGQYAYTVVLAESPPLPPPAEVSPFGGLDDLGGLGDLGFGDIAGALGDVAAAAEAATAALDTVMDAVKAVEGLAALAGGLGDLSALSDPLKPITDKLSELEPVGNEFAQLATLVGQLANP